MAGQPRTRRQKEQLHQLAMRENIRNYREQTDDERAETLKALKRELLKNGVVEWNVDPAEALQRAIDDTTLDYLLIRQQIDAELGDDPNRLDEFFDHDLYPEAVRLRHEVTQYATYAMQYKLTERAIRISEARTALLAYTLQRTLEELDIPYDTIKRVPGLLIKNLTSGEHAPNIDPQKAEVLAEIMLDNAEFEIVDIDTPVPARNNGRRRK
jgi:hypothetical protein